MRPQLKSGTPQKITFPGSSSTTWSWWLGPTLRSLLTLMTTKPHSMSLMVKPKVYKPNSMLRLLYERVPHHRQPIMQHLDDPVIEYIPLTRRVQNHRLTELPMGKYIVCGEAMVLGEVYQASCFETRIERMDNNSEYNLRMDNSSE